MHTAAHLFKQLLRDLKDPLIPQELHERALQIGAMKNQENEIKLAINDFVKDMGVTHPHHRLTLLFLLEQLQSFTQPKVVDKTKMNAENLATLFTPNIIPCKSADLNAHLKYSSHGKSFVQHLINHVMINNNP